jgi:hypothetical protein
MFCFKAGFVGRTERLFTWSIWKSKLVWESNTNGILDLDYRWIFLLSALIMRCGTKQKK